MLGNPLIQASEGHPYTAMPTRNRHVVDQSHGATHTWVPAFDVVNDSLALKSCILRSLKEFQNNIDSPSRFVIAFTLLEILRQYRMITRLSWLTVSFAAFPLIEAKITDTMRLEEYPASATLFSSLSIDTVSSCSRERFCTEREIDLAKPFFFMDLG